MQGSIQPRLESMERSALTQEDGAEHQGSCQPSPAQPSSCRTAASASHGRVGGQQELPESPLPPACCRTAAPGSSGGSPRDSAPIPPQSTAWERAQSTHTGCGLWGVYHPEHQLHPQHPAGCGVWGVHHPEHQLTPQAVWEQCGVPLTLAVSSSVPHPECHTLLPTGQSPCTSPETLTLLWGLCLNSLQMQKAQLDVFTHRTRSAPHCCTSLAAFHSTVPLRQPTSLLFLLSSFPRFCAALPRIPCATQQPALLHSSPSLLLSHHFFWICCSQRSRN